MTKALDLAKFGRETAPLGDILGTTDTQTLSAKTFSDMPVFSSGVANAVPYLSGTKVLTTGTALTFNGTTLVVAGTINSTAINTGNINTGSNMSTEDVAIELGGNRSGSGNVYVDLHATASTDYEARFIRLSGTNGATNILHRGTGDLAFNAEAAAPMTFLTTGTERMRINATGNIGIGTSSPTARLQVNAPNTTTESLTFGAAAGQIFRNEDSELAFGLSSNSPYNLYLQGRTNTNTARDLIIQPLGGNVGIGTSAPSEKLTVNGSIDLPTINTYIKGGGHNVLQVDATRTYFYGGTSGVQFRTADNASALVDITNSGNVGIGVTPSDAFNFGKAVDIGSTSGSFYYCRDTDATNGVGGIGYSGTDLYIANAAAGNIRFFCNTDGTERARIDSTGNFGIGTTAPNNKLHVLSTSTNAAVAKFAASNYGNLGTTYIEIGTQYSDGSSRIGSRNPGGNNSLLVFETMTGTSGVFAERMRIDSSGTLSLRNNQTRKLSLEGNYGKYIHETLEYNHGTQDEWFQLFLPQHYADSPQGAALDIKVVRLPIHASRVRVYEYKLHQSTWDNSGAYYNTLYRVSEKESGWDYYSYTFSVTFYYPTSNVGSNAPLYMKISGFHVNYSYATFIDITGIVGSYAGDPVLTKLSSAPALGSYSVLSAVAF